jgi:non-heme chloroperoxidase
MAELKSIQVNGVDLAYVEAGTGEPVVLIHGLPNDYRVWGPQVAGLSGGYHVIAYSRRCAYPNKHDDGRDDGVAANADDLAALLESLPSKSAHLVGHSYGGFVALYCAHRHPELVRSMVLCEPAVTSLLTTNPRNPLSLISLLLRDGEGARALLHFANSTARPAQRALKEGDALRASKLFVDGLGGPGAF